MNEKDFIIGIDEVGRGPMAGPTTVCASLIEKSEEVFLKKELPFVKDSKKMTEKRREDAFKKIKILKEVGKIFSAVSFVSAEDIDKIGISQAIQRALNSSLENLEKHFLTSSGNYEKIKFSEIEVLLDGGLQAPKKFVNQQTIIKGDDSEFIISLSSVIAKVIRDKEMKKLALKFPQYYWEKNKGYGTKQHREAIQKHGLTKLHRKTFCKSYRQPC